MDYSPVLLGEPDNQLQCSRYPKICSLILYLGCTPSPAQLAPNFKQGYKGQVLEIIITYDSRFHKDNLSVPNWLQQRSSDKKLLNNACFANKMTVASCVYSWGGTLLLTGLPNTIRFLENQAVDSSVFTFSVNSTTAISSGYPVIINTSPLTKAFKMTYSPPTYNVVITGSPNLDFETMPNSFDLQIYVENTRGDTDLQLLTVQLIDVNEPPVFQDNLANQAVNVYITEGSPIGTIYQIQVTDPEDAKPTLTFSLIPASAPFSVSSTGSIFSTKIFDYESDPHSYSLTVNVKDPKGLSVNGTLNVIIMNINDETPYFTITTTTFRIPEEQSPGTSVANITAIDPDGGFISTLLYTINTPTEYFTINERTGDIQIAMTIDREADPFRLHPNIVLEIEVRDKPSGGHSNKTFITFIIEDLNDNPPVCTKYAFSKSVPETEINGTLIIDLKDSCSDVDVTSLYNQFNFTGLSGLGSNERFQMIPAGSGQIVLTGDLNYESPNNLAVGNEYSLKVVVQDIAFPYYKQNLYVYVKTIPVNEFPPVFNSSTYVFNISELSPPGTKIGQLYATDRDYPINVITYSIVGGGSTLGATSIFWINPNTANLELAYFADYETTKQYILLVQAADQGPLYSTATVTVNIFEANDEKPVCLPKSYSLSIPSNTAIGTNIQNFKLTCTDRDSSPNSFRYFINSGNINNHFTLSPDAGSNITSLVLANPFDYSGGVDTTFIYNLRVYITDDNLLTAAQRASTVVQTGSVSIQIYVYIPGLTTLKTTTTPGIIYVTTTKNAYSASAWYLPFVITIGSLLLLGLLGYLTYLLAKHCPCRSKPKPDTERLISPPEKKKVKHDVFWEMTKINTVFDGEAQDPITGKIYEYNSKSGARRWKETQQPIPIESTQSLPQVAVIPGAPTVPIQEKDKMVSPKGTPNKREKTPMSPVKTEEAKTEKPATANRLNTPPKVESNKEGNVRWSPRSPRLSPKVSPKIPKTPT
ncbi:cadherin-related family member 3 [Bombina bombina]|uniref:cadherin-related family member 3 n=1 Tax=Bombina bombina TaxID=8345 RepID=UPI00235AD15B|nr:cadherin-related family member 3 [Bombina bombina]